MDNNELTDFPPTHPPAYSSRKDGYGRLPQSEHYPPPSGYSAPAPPMHSGYAPAPPMHSGYAPAPPVMQQQSNNNVVVVGNQPTPQTVVHVQPRANEYMWFSIVLMILCFFHGNLPAMLFCLVPALICSFAARDHNNAGDYEGASSCGRAALGCNILAMVYFVVLVLAGIAMVLVYFFVLREEINNGINTIVTSECCLNG